MPVRPEHAVLAAIAVAVGVLAGIDPKLALIAAAGSAFVLVVLADVTAGLCLVALLGFVDQLPQVEDSSLTLTKFAGALLAVSWFASVTTATRVKTFVTSHPTMTYVLAFFLAWVALSLAWSESFGAGVEAFVRYGLNGILFLIVFSAVSDRRRALWVVGAFVVAATATTVYGVLSPSGASPDGGVARLGSTVGDPNELAAVLVAGFFLAIALAGALRGSLALRVGGIAAAALCMVGIFLSVSRGGLVALGVGVLCALFLAGRWRPAVALAATVAALAGVIYFAGFAPPSASERLTLADQGSGRVDIWTVGWRMVEDRPVTGVGAGNFERSAIRYLLEPGSLLHDEFIVVSPKVAHNIYLQVLAELGVVGLAAFLAILGFSLSCAFKAAGRFRQSGDVSMELLARGLLLALIGLLVADFFVSEQYSKQLWLLLGLAPALLALARRPPEEESPAGGSSSGSVSSIDVPVVPAAR